MLCSVLVNIDQQKLGIWKYYILKFKFHWIFFLLIFIHFIPIPSEKKIVKEQKGLGGGTQTLMVRLL